jgi:hypothetical protein
VTTLTKIDKIQKLESTASFWMAQNACDVEREDRASPSANSETIAGA